MLVTKTRAVPRCKEKSKKERKKYYTPTCYSSQKKSPDNVSGFYKKEDAI